MTDQKLRIVEELVSKIPTLTAGQLYWLERVVNVFESAHYYAIANSDLFDIQTLENFGDAMRIHHSFSAEPFSKDKFEYAVTRVLTMSGHQASLARKGSPGHDATVDGVRLSLKTQADSAIREDRIWISKFMELGKGKWGDDPRDLKGLRQQFLEHLKNYDRVLSLRALHKAPRWRYELVEIPKGILEMARDGELEMMVASKQFPKPGYCYVRNERGELMYELYFDAGGERKLQVKNLWKKFCSVHATWEFVIPQE